MDTTADLSCPWRWHSYTRLVGMVWFLWPIPAKMLKRLLWFDPERIFILLLACFFFSNSICLMVVNARLIKLFGKSFLTVFWFGQIKSWEPCMPRLNLLDWQVAFAPCTPSSKLSKLWALFIRFKLGCHLNDMFTSTTCSSNNLIVLPTITCPF